MAAQEEGGFALGFKDRSGWLVFFGIVEILIGAFCALAAPLMLLGMLFSAAVPQGQAQPFGMGMMIPMVLFYVAAAVFFIWMGIGTLRGRRWARAIMLILAWLWLIGGIFGLGFWLLLWPDMFAATPPGTPPMPEGVKSFMRVFMTVLMAVIYVLLPGSFVLFYGRQDVKATFERKDPQLRWTDRCPLPVLAVSLMLGYCSVGCLFALGYGMLPVFGQILTGVPAGAALLVLALPLGFLAREVYRLRMVGWWGAVALSVLGGISNVVTFTRHSMFDVYARMGLTAQQLEPLKAMHLMDRFSIPLWTVVYSVAALGYLFYIRRYFVGGEADTRLVGIG